VTTDDSIVSVIIPAYNAEATISETLLSVRTQSHRNLDIIVVDDGSNDETARLASEQAEADGRIRVISKENAGVASARNLGAAEAASETLAFVDADDLWAKSKIERQLAALNRGGCSVGLVYGWSTRIDGAGCVIDDTYRPNFLGRVLPQLVKWNFIGNGSCALVRRKAFEHVGGFEPGLREAGSEGCEDILFCCRIAEHYDFAVVPEHIVGYRITKNNMSSDGPKMMRSWLLMVEELLARNPELAPELHEGVGNFACWLLQRALANRQIGQISNIVTTLMRFDPSLAVKVTMLDWPPEILRAVKRRRPRWPRRAADMDVNSEPRRFMAGAEN